MAKEAFVPFNFIFEMDIIWNLTRVCHWGCSFCCVDAVRSSHQISAPEPSLDEKLQIIRSIATLPVKLDISGGDPLVSGDNLNVIRYASSLIGKQNVTVTATGISLSNGHCLKELCNNIAELNITYDSPLTSSCTTRPDQYLIQNHDAIKCFLAFGGSVRAECPLTVDNARIDTIRSIYMELHALGVQNLLLMRYFPVGRALGRTDIIPAKHAIEKVIAEAERLAEIYIYPQVSFQCALKSMISIGKDINPCDLLKRSLGVMPNGNVLLSPWAYGHSGEALDPRWVIGNLLKDTMVSIMQKPRVLELIERLNENTGHCKVYAWLNSKKGNFIERLVDKSDSHSNSFVVV